MKDTEINIQHKSAHYPVKQKAGTIPLHVQEYVGRELDTVIKTGHLKKLQDIDEDHFVQPVENTFKSYDSVKIALNSTKLNDSCVKMTPHLPNKEELSNKTQLRLTQDRLAKNSSQK